MIKPIGIKEANEMICDLYVKNNIRTFYHGFKYFLAHRKETTITIQDVTLKWKKISRKICVDKNELQQETDKTIKKLQKTKWLKENGTLEQKADNIHGQFVSFYYDRHSGKERTDYFCRKCEKQAEEKNDKEECHVCRDWNSCGRDCKLSHLICKNCNITQLM